MPADIAEKGRVSFFYRPRVGRAEVGDIDDVQRLHMVLRPLRTERFRVLVIGRKHMPEVEEVHERLWAAVVDVVDGIDRLRETLRPRTYDTKTLGRRELSATRPAGDGVYALSRHRDHTHLAYELLHPEKPGEVQREFKLRREASYIITVRNPCRRPPPEVPAEVPAGTALPVRFPGDLQARFGDRRFAPVDPPDFLDFAGAEFILIGAASDPARELGIDLHSQAERLGMRDLFEELRLSWDRRLEDPLEKGEWR
jgi:hypothetical protein